MASKKWLEYQNMTTRAKQFGGADNYQLALLAGGYVMFRVGEFAFKKLFHKFRTVKEQRENRLLQGGDYEVLVLTDEQLKVLENVEVSLSVGDKINVKCITILDDVETALVEVNNDEQAIFYIPVDLLESISDYNSRSQ